MVGVEAGAGLVVPLPAPEDAPGAVAYDQRNSGPAFAGRRVALQRVGRTREEDILADLAAGRLACVPRADNNRKPRQPGPTQLWLLRRVPMGATVPLVRRHAFLADVSLARVAVVIALAAAIRQVGPPAAAPPVTGSHGAVSSRWQVIT